MNSIIRHLKIYKKDVSQTGISIALINILWFVRKYIPKTLFSSLMRKKHWLLERKITDVVGAVSALSMPVVQQKHIFEKSPIWFCWLQGQDNLLPITQMCLNSIRKNCNNHPVVFIDLQTYKDYIALPANIVRLFEASKIGYAHFADIIRTCLLYHYGGCWIDSTILVTKELDETLFQSIFYSVKLSPDSFFVSRARWSNFFLACQAGNPIMGHTLALFYKYLTIKDYFIDYFMMDYLMDMVIRENVTLENQIEAIPYNNPNVHRLKNHLEEACTTERLNNIIGDTYIHKLSWKNCMGTPNPNTVYSYFYNLYR
ncbi:capsular polysaccharide synthesis protein [Bacteroides sp.]